MILEHVAQYPNLVIKAGAMFNTNLLGNCDFYMVNVIPVPQRFEDGIGKTRYQNVLYCFFTKIMIDTIDLFLIQCLVDLLIQVAGGFQIRTKRFFNDDTSPSLTLLELIRL